MRKPLSAALLSLLLFAGCGKGGTVISVGGHDLLVKETNYGQADYFCNNLANGQYEVVISDFTLCGDLHVDAGNRTTFHSSDETNIRIIFPSFLKVTGNSFTVGHSDCNNSADPNTEAVFIFEHNSAGSAKYDYSAQADSGTIVITSTADSVKKDSQISGTYDVMIAGAHLTGPITALFCAPLIPGLGI